MPEALLAGAAAVLDAQEAATSPRSPRSASSSAVSSSEESDSDSDQDPEVEPQLAASEELWLYNTIVGKAHMAIKCTEDYAPTRRIAHAGAWWLTACGTTLLMQQQSYVLGTDVPEGAALCETRACIARMTR